jgi:hypothetical protein
MDGREHTRSRDRVVDRQLLGHTDTSTPSTVVATVHGAPV